MGEIIVLHIKIRGRRKPSMPFFFNIYWIFFFAKKENKSASSLRHNRFFFCQTRLIARFLLEPSPILEALGNRSFNYGLRWPFSFLGTRLLDGSHQQELARRLVFSLSLSLSQLIAPGGGISRWHIRGERNCWPIDSRFSLQRSTISIGQCADL